MRHVCLWHRFKYAWEGLPDSMLSRTESTPQNVPFILKGLLVHRPHSGEVCFVTQIWCNHPLTAHISVNLIIILAIFDNYSGDELSQNRRFDETREEA